MGLSSSIRNDLFAAAGELIGTCLFIFLALTGVQAALSQSTGVAGVSAAQILGIAFSFGFSLLICVWIFFRISGGVFNPAVLLALMLTGNIPLVKGALYFVAEMVGAIAGAGFAELCTPGPLAGVNALTVEGPNAISLAEATFLEMFLTTILILAVFFLAVEKSRTTFMAPVGVGIAVFVAHLIGSPYDGTSINPARSFAAAAVTGKFASDHWVFWVGPFLGSFLATGIYQFFKWGKYELLNPQADAKLPLAKPNPSQTVPLERVQTVTE